MAQLNKDKYATLGEARDAYRKWQDGCTQLHWCVLPFDEWLYDRDRSAEMEREIANAEEGRYWNCTRSCISRPLSKFEKEYETVVGLPFKHETNALGKEVEGWPSDKVALERCEKAMREVGEWAERAARVLADTRFFAEKKHDKVLPPRNKMKG